MGSKEKDNEIFVVTGGGSGGHTVTALSVIDALVRKHPDMKKHIVYIGGGMAMEGEKDRMSVEERMATAKGIKFVKIRSGKLQRRFSFKTLSGLTGVLGGIVDSFKFFRKNSVSAVFSSGGYVTVPVCFIAWLSRAPIVIHEQTTRVGLANKISSKFAKSVLVGFPEAEEYFNTKKVKVVGNTVRRSLLDKKAWSRSAVSKMRAFKNRSKEYPIVMIAGGGQGSHLMNSNVMLALKTLMNHFQLIVITGDNRVTRDYEKLTNCLKKLTKEQQRRIIVTKFAEGPELGAYFNSAEIYVGRSGAMFVYELGVIGVPAVLIPIPWVTHNEQYHNAKALEEIGLANIVSEGVLSPEILFQEIQRMATRIRNGLLRVDEEKRKKIFVMDAASKIVAELEDLNLL